jgi:hypothetical protein
MARRDEGEYPNGSSTEEQRSQAVFSSKTLRAAGLLPVAIVGSEPHSPLRGCSLARPARTLAALATAKIPRRGTPRNFQTGS